MSPNEEKAALKDFATRWRQLGPELESMKSKSLRERTEDEHRRAIIDVLSGPLAWFLKGSTADSGLVKQQEIFAKLCRN
ncbi:MAG: hypothetical protein JHC52_08665 [Chthoniobacterales bacterium]|jgi:hypothetical protein|nr:hypothetical protein [Chthoniobacterales bacterium]